MHPAWHLDSSSLREVVDDGAALEERLAAAGDLERIWLLRLLGRLDEARAAGETVLDEAPQAPERWRALPLLADVCAYQEDHVEAERLQVESLTLASALGPLQEATVDQYIGKRLFDQALYEQAAQCFVTALRLRRDNGAAAELIESSRMALKRATELSQEPAGRHYERRPLSPRPAATPDGTLPGVTFERYDDADLDALVEFLTSEDWPWQQVPSATPDTVRHRAAGGFYNSASAGPSGPLRPVAASA